MATRKCGSVQGLRGNLLVDLGQQGVVYDNSQRHSQPERKYLKDQSRLNKEHCKENYIKDIRKPNPSFQDAQINSKDDLPSAKISRCSSSKTRTDLGPKISDDILSIMVDDPELLDMISSMQTKKSSQSEVEHVDITKNIVQTFNKTVAEISCQYSTAKSSPMPSGYTQTETNIYDSGLPKYFESFTAENSTAVTSQKRDFIEQNRLNNVTYPEGEIESSKANFMDVTLEETDYTEQNRLNNVTYPEGEIESTKANTMDVTLEETDFTERNKQNNVTHQEREIELSKASTMEVILEETDSTSLSRVIVEIRQETPAETSESKTLENEISALNNSNDSISILINTPEPQNQLSLENEPKIYEDTFNSRDREWIPGNDDKLSSDTDVTDAESLPGDQILQQNNISHNAKNEKVKKKRRRIADPSQWNDIKNKKRRECGEDYKGWTKQKGGKAKRGAERSKRELGSACNSDHCKKSRDCQKIIETEREFMFNFFWKKMSWDQKKVYVASLVSKEEPKRRTTGDANTSRRKISFAYSLKTEDGKIFKVCKKMFLFTLGLNECMVTNWVKDSKGGMSGSTKERNIVRQKEQIAANRKYLEDFLDQLPKLPSHYCRKSTSKIYLEPTFRNSMSEIYNEYVKQCADCNPPQKALSRFTFDVVIKEKNIGFQPPKKDRCDLCISFETGNIEEAAYQNHLAKKKRAREEKDTDKSDAEEGICDVLTMDLQAVKICPSLNASALYYKTKLCVHNFTIYNIKTHHCRCYWFDETEADLTANTFASCLIDYLSNTVSERQVSVIIWSDGCTYQNRNATLSNALLSFSVSKGITIYQKYLTKGHTQMEADSVHANIERKIKNKSIHLPSDYIRLTSEARRDPEPYEVKSLEFTFCRNYGVDMVYPSIRPGKSAGDPQVTDITVIKYSPSGIISVKTSFDDDFQDLPKKRGKRAPVKPLEDFSQLHKQKIPIKKQKWLHLQQLKQVIPRDCHNFYNNLPYA